MTNDLISRSALKKTFENACIYGLPMNELYGAILKIIDNAPAVDTSDAKYLEERDADAYETGYLQGHVDGYIKAEKDYAKSQGEWITIKVDTDLDDTVCSICGKSCEDIEGTPHKTNFCSNCGADMRGDNK